MKDSNKDMLRVSEAAKILGISPQTLRNWEKSGRITAQRSPGGQRYYRLSEVRRLAVDLPKLAWAWAASSQAPTLPDEYYCDRQDRFTSRLVKMAEVLQKTLGTSGTDIVSLLTQVAGEIGDNAFTHNIGSWPDVPGVFYGYDTVKRSIVVADRGRGVRATLQRVRPAIASDQEALHIAFTEIVSGRDPEKRGNGLKLVRSVVENNPIGLTFRSGVGLVSIPANGAMQIKQVSENVRGVYAVITY